MDPSNIVQQSKGKWATTVERENPGLSEEEIKEIRKNQYKHKYKQQKLDTAIWKEVTTVMNGSQQSMEAYLHTEKHKMAQYLNAAKSAMCK
jgi:hypothetical protein